MRPMFPANTCRHFKRIWLDNSKNQPNGLFFYERRNYTEKRGEKYLYHWKNGDEKNDGILLSCRITQVGKIHAISKNRISFV